MILHYLILILSFLSVYINAIDIQVKGSVSFEVINPRKEVVSRADDAVQQPVMNVTAASFLECVYQHPEQKQVDSLLSNMMNELADVFVRAQQIVDEDTRRKHSTGSRFKVVSKKKSDFFEDIYNNMTEEYREFYKSKLDRVDRTVEDPCLQQERVRGLWHELMSGAVATLRRGARDILLQHLQLQNNATELNPLVLDKLERFLDKEMMNFKTEQLHFLCDTYQLCYNDLFD